MRKIIIFVITLMIMAGAYFIYGNTNSNPYDLPALEADYYLYLVEDNEGNSMYLLGTMHIGAEPIKFDGKLLEAYNKCDALALELSYDSMKLPDDILTVNPLSERTDIEFLEKFKMLKESYKNVREDTLQYNLIGLNQIMTMEVIKELGVNTADGLDYTMYEKATKDGKAILSLETLEESINMNYSFVKDFPTVYMREVMVSKEKSKAETISLIEMYANGNIVDDYILSEEALYVTDKSLPIPAELYNTKDLQQEYEKQRDITNISRNEKMASKATEHMKEYTMFVAVGLAHLHGEDGLIRLFEKNGLKVIKL